MGRVVVFGPGAVGSCIASWLAESGVETAVYGRATALDRIESSGLSHYEGSKGRASASVARPAALRSLEGLEEEDLLVFCTKNTGLEKAAKEAAEACDSRPFALSLANGIDNQEILPAYFPRCGFGIVGFNCWLDEPGLVGWQSRGPLLLGTPDNSHLERLREIASLFSRGLPTETTPRFNDAAHAKIVINLANTVTTLVGQGYRPIEDVAALQRLLAQTLAEGVRVVRAAGYRSHRLGSMPSFTLIQAMASLPGFVTRSAFKKNLARMVRSSMSQDVVQRGLHDTELESLTGYIVGLAARQGLAAPWNEGLLRIARERFAAERYEALEPARLLEMLEKK